MLGGGITDFGEMKTKTSLGLRFGLRALTHTLVVSTITFLILRWPSFCAVCFHRSTSLVFSLLVGYW
jgi:hypothetical protein